MTGRAAVEFWSRDRPLGRARPHPDGRTFSLGLDGSVSARLSRGPPRTEELSVRAGGVRIDQIPPPRPVGVAGARDLALSVIVPPNSTGTRFGVTVVGTDGRRSALGEIRIDGLPGTDQTTSHWAQEVRVPLHRAPARVAAVELTPRTASGRAWLLDAWGWRPVLPARRSGVS
ncbi:hypothetical protein ACN27G_09830 [Plantactinospora sp. WMMB334]|uniref:hypothetical protein n=1 Tax=Plantactinospora sp. WMMB334 TaxID=3404119 RepID=UPI003B958BC2